MVRSLTLVFVLFSFLYAQLPATKVEQLQNDYNFSTILGEPVSVVWKTAIIPESLKSQILDKFKFKRTIEDTVVYGQVNGSADIDYIWLDTAPSKQMWFIYLLGINKKGEIGRIEILHYPETHGGQISHPGFRKQFYGISDPKKLRFGRKIQSISGATISSRNLTKTVKDLLFLHNILKENNLLD